MKRTLSALVLGAALAFSSVPPAVYLGVGVSAIVVSQTACPQSKTLADYSHKVVRGLNVAIPIFESNGQDTALLIKARDLAFKAEMAFQKNNNASGAATITDLVAVFDIEIMAQVNRITNPTVRTIVLVGLAVANDQLHELLDKLDEMSANAPSEIKGMNKSAVSAFKNKGRWKCRNSENGQYASMSYCKEHPATSEVETQ